MKKCKKNYIDTHSKFVIGTQYIEGLQDLFGSVNVGQGNG
jgi:hypothetical protein